MLKTVFMMRKPPQNWQQIRLDNVSYHLSEPNRPSVCFNRLHSPSAAAKPFSDRRQRLPGKSTLCMLLAGLYTPSSGKIWVDDIEIGEHNRHAYRQLFASVFTDFHLFDQLMDGFGGEVAEQWIADWLSHLQLADKAKIEQGKLLNKRLSQGQKKRLALLLAAALEQRSILLLDEWAAAKTGIPRAVLSRTAAAVETTRPYRICHQPRR